MVFLFVATAKEPTDAAKLYYPVVQAPHHAWASWAIPLPRKATTPDPRLTTLREAAPR